ncbi:acetyl-coenzyme-A carboxylase [Allomyces javanicus]|nr:acetyl-coenzyme-A carboxylase [Allomyces javanicus]
MTRLRKTSLTTVSPSAVRDHVLRLGGSKPIESILIANNGIAAVKEIRSVRKWAYETFGDERAIKFVAMATPEDLTHNAEYIRMADHFIQVPGGSNNHNYANVDLIVEVAESAGVDAVWAGWGHASENPRLPDQLAAKNIVFIGPPGNAMRALGDKISSTIVAQSAKVPTMGWSGDGLVTTARNAAGYVDVPEDLYMKACVTDVEQALNVADRVGYPLMIKASEGGGGKGIRKVTDPATFRAAFAQVAAEVPGSPIFLMRLAENARHLEVQIIADEHGNVISLFGRDCSVQRRHQKIIEEAPVTIADEALFADMEMSAVRLAQLVGYVNAGTIEFLYNRSKNEYYFLELNPRLQVEHPCSEIVSGVNIPAAQLQVAMGIPLHRIPHIRLMYGLPPTGTSPIDFHFTDAQSIHRQRKPAPRGHVIACRITAENPDAGFKPSGGQLVELNFRSSTDVWGYFSVSPSGGLHEFADSQFGHVFAFGHDRQSSRRNMIMALKELRIRGDFRTTVEYLIKLLETADFASNDFSTAWLDSLIEQNVQAERPDTWVSVVCGAAVKAFAAAEAQKTLFLKSLDKGQVATLANLQHAFPVSFILEGIRYEVEVAMAARDVLVLHMNGSHVVVRTRGLPDGGVLVTFDNTSHVIYSTEEVGGTRLSLGGRTVVLEEESDPTQLRSPSPGKLVRWLMPEGGHVSAGQAYAEIEVMKMIMPLVATDAGHLHAPMKQAGAPVAAGEVLATLELDDMSQVKKAVPCTQTFPTFASPAPGLVTLTKDELAKVKSHQRFLELQATVEQALDGFAQVSPLSALLHEYVEIQRRQDLPYLHTLQVLSSYHGRLPNTVEPQLQALLADQAKPFPHDELLSLLSAVPDYGAVAPLVHVVSTYAQGADAHVLDSLTYLLQRYYSVESLFTASDASGSVQKEKVVLELRTRMDAEALYWTCFSHARLGWKTACVAQVLDTIAHHRAALTHTPNSATLFASLTNLADVGARGGAANEHVSIKIRARALLIALQMPDFEERYQQFAKVLLPAAKSLQEQTEEIVFAKDDLAHELVESTFSIFDALPCFFYPHVHLGDRTIDHSLDLRLTALSTYVRRAYNTYRVLAIRRHPGLTVPVVEWHFQFPPAATAANNALSSSRSSLSRVSSAASMMSDFSRTASASDLTLTVKRGDMGPVRIGIMAAVNDVAELRQQFDNIVQLYPLATTSDQSWHVLNIALKSAHGDGVDSDSELDDSTGSAPDLTSMSYSAAQTNDRDVAVMLSSLMTSQAAALRARGIRRVTVLVYRTGQYPRYFTFREKLGYQEDLAIRHIEPSHAFQLELHRLANFSLQPVVNPANKSIHVYHAVGKENPSDTRFFVRAIVRPGKLATAMSTVEYLTAQADGILNDILSALELATAAHKNIDLNHLFLNFLPKMPVTVDQVQESIAGFIMRHGTRLWKLRVTNAEIRFVCAPPGTPDEESGTTYRFFISNVSGVIKAETYKEVKDARGRRVLETVMTAAASGKGEMHLQRADFPYPIKEQMQPKRYRAHVLGTTYVYDYLELFREATNQAWARHPHLARPTSVLLAQELVLDETGTLRKTMRAMGTNTCGMVAWLMTLKTPECPAGRQVVLIANDITYAIGSFGPAEDHLFHAASKMARELGVPRIYISANSGARIGLAEEVMAAYRVHWVDAQDPGKGFHYLYLTPEDHDRLKGSVITEPVTDTETGALHHKIIDIIGAKDGLGVENLMGSGLIAGETSAAYDDIFTITLVSCRSVGIGAYLVRLGQRAIQCEGQPIILTGAAALNKVLGRDVYTSNLQLGGIQIMHRNGVSHLTCVDSLHGVHQMIQWLSYVPASRGAPLPVLRTPVAVNGRAASPMDAAESPLSPAMLASNGAQDAPGKAEFDPVERDIDFVPTKQPYDPRHMLHGHVDTESGAWVAGFFDRGSWMETMDGWSKTVIVGRGRLGGVPLGAIAVETRAVEAVVPADPANPDSAEQVVIEPPGVWTPASAYKTAQAIQDLGREGLPLVIFANWRGFSGGQRDMHEAILKYGSYIVDALRTYPGPVFVYIVPHGELRGGAWVVLDPSIHQDHGMEMYADTTARGGVLEPEGIVEIKYRKPQMVATIDRLDDQCRRWKARLAAAAKAGKKDDSDDSDEAAELEAIKNKLQARQKSLLPAYHQAALKFADLHDTPGRMKAKGAIRRVLEWRTARSFFYGRVRRLVAEHRARAALKRASPALVRDEVTKLLAAWYAEDRATPVASWDDVDDLAAAEWLEAAFDAAPADATTATVAKEWRAKTAARVDALETTHLAGVIAKILRDKPQAAVAGLAQSLLPAGVAGAGAASQGATALATTLASLGQLASILKP